MDNADASGNKAILAEIGASLRGMLERWGFKAGARLR
jgi:hypothetical protein